MLGEVNFHSKPQWFAWAEYSVLTTSLVVAMAVLATT
jgi:hypothetical protein